MVTQMLAESRERTRKAFAAGERDRRTEAAARLREIADRLCSQAWDAFTLSAAERLIENAQRNMEARAAHYTIEATGEAGEAPPFAVFAHVEGARLQAGEFPEFDGARRYCSDIYRRRAAHFSIDRVAPGVWATRPFRIGTTTAAQQEGMQS